MIYYAILTFLIGSIPTGYLIGRFFYGTDIREQGSGNIGAMNALRTLGKSGAVAVLLLDALKGFVPIFFVLHVLKLDAPSWYVALIGSLAILGHCFSPWLGFKGGKGVATAFGAFFGLMWPVGLIAVAGWLAGAAVTRYSSAGSMLGVATAPFSLWFMARSPWMVAFGLFAALLVVFTHRENIARLRAGDENPIRFSRSPS
jgi:glycerol-3-phosphate acyltransferase PlsY